MTVVSCDVLHFPLMKKDELQSCLQENNITSIVITLSLNMNQGTLGQPLCLMCIMLTSSYDRPISLKWSNCRFVL